MLIFLTNNQNNPLRYLLANKIITINGTIIGVNFIDKIM